MPHTISIGGSNPSGFPLQFPNETIGPSSFAVTPIFCLANDGTNSIITHGTGFIWKVGDRHFLITSRHVLTGRDAFTDEILSPLGYLPRRIQIFPSVHHPQPEMSRVGNDFILDLYRDDVPLWFEDPQLSTLRTDIAALELNLGLPREWKLVALNHPDSLTPVLTQPGFDCAILGYPNTNIAQYRTPIWKRGTIASEPRLPIDGMPMFLVDAATSPGFSGAPVIRRHIGPAPERMPDGTVTVHFDRVYTTCFIGVYGGRLENRHSGGEIAYAFYGNRIDEILRGR